MQGIVTGRADISVTCDDRGPTMKPGVYDPNRGPDPGYSGVSTRSQLYADTAYRLNPAVNVSAFSRAQLPETYEEALANLNARFFGAVTFAPILRQTPPKAEPVRLIGIWAPAPQSGKTTARDALLNALGDDSDIIAFADPMRDVIHGLLDAAGVPADVIIKHMTDGALKEVPIPGVGKSFVELAIKIGTDLGRGWLGEDFWVNAFKFSVSRAYYKTTVVCDDVRFPNEAKAIRDLGGVMLGVYRPGASVSAQRAAAEGHLTLGSMDAVILNDTMKSVFEARVVVAAKSLGLPL